MPTNPERARWRRYTAIGTSIIAALAAILLVVTIVAAVTDFLPAWIFGASTAVAVLLTAFFYWSQRRQWPKDE
jgi:O-antigen/teichoic acid export membrane protein